MSSLYCWRHSQLINLLYLLDQFRNWGVYKSFVFYQQDAVNLVSFKATESWLEPAYLGIISPW